MLKKSLTIQPDVAAQMVHDLTGIEADMFSILVMVGNLNRIGKAGKYDDAIERFARRNKEQAEKLIKQLSAIQIDAICTGRSPNAEQEKPQKIGIRRRPKPPEQKVLEIAKLRDEMIESLNDPALSSLEKLLFGNGLLPHTRN